MAEGEDLSSADSASDVTPTIPAMRPMSRIPALEKRLEDITRLVSDWIWEVDEGIRFSFVSHRVADILGRHPMVLLGKRFAEISTFVDNDGAGAEPDWQRPFRDRPFEAKDGSGLVRHLLISGVPVFDGHSGAFTGVRGTARDITARRRAESELTRQKNMFESVFRDAPDAMAVVDADERIIMCNPALSSIFGRPGDQLMGVSPAILYAGVDEYARHRRYLSEREGGGLADAAERGPFLGRFRRKGGEVFSGELVASAVTGADGRTIAKVLVIRDVTERERAETALRDSEERFRNLVEGTVRGILIDIDGKPVFANRAYARIFGYADPAEILALDSIDGLHAPQERERAARFRRRRLLGGNAPDQYEVQCLRQDGTLIWVEILLRVVTWNGQRAVQSTIVDISERKRTEAALRDSEARFRSIFEHSALGITLTSPEGRYRLVNSAMTRILGYPERELMAMRYLDIIHPDDRAAERVQRRRLLRGIIDNYMMEQRYVRRDGTICWGMVSASVVRDAKGRVLYSIRQHHDITQRRNMEKSLRASEARFRAVIDNAPVGIVLKDRDGAVLMAGRQYEVWNGLRHGEALGKSIHDFLPREQADLLAADDHQVMATGLGSQREIDVRLADGRVHTFLSVNFPIPGPDGEVANVGVVSTDITQRKRAERELNAAQEELIRKANYDDLTGLPNRVLFLDRLSQSLLRARRDKELVALLFIDLDHFKVVNDTLGHAAGDQLLRQTARRLSRCVREEDTVARLGGDEFTVILPGIATGDDAATVAGKIVRKLNRPFTIEGQEVFATASIGITLYPADGDDAETIVKNADAAMYNAKEYGRNNYRFYTRAINDKAMRMLRLETDLPPLERSKS